MLRLACAVLAIVPVLVLFPAPAATAVTAAPNDCTLTVSGPFFYAEMVFPAIEITCGSVKQRIRIDAALDRNGVQVATARRVCKNAKSCVTGLAADGVWTTDSPGNQHWCGRGSGVVRTKTRTHVFPEKVTCESDTF